MDARLAYVILRTDRCMECASGREAMVGTCAKMRPFPALGGATEGHWSSLKPGGRQRKWLGK